MTDLHQTIKDKIIVALDMPCQDEARKIIAATSDYVGFYKVGMGFLANDGIKFAQDLVKEGHKIFLDLKNSLILAKPLQMQYNALPIVACIL